LPQVRAASDLVLPSKLGGMLATERPIPVTAYEGTELHDILKDVAYRPTGDATEFTRELLLQLATSQIAIVRVSSLSFFRATEIFQN
jgi:hypothetical protein